MELIAEPQEILNEHAISLSPRAWFSETDRWENLVFCLLRQYCDQDPKKARLAVTVLRDRDLVDFDRLSSLDKIPLEFNEAFSRVLISSGFSEENTTRAACLLTQVVGVINNDCDGKINHILRHHGKATRDEFINAFLFQSTL